MSEAASLSDIHELVRIVEIVEVRTYVVSAVRNLSELADLPPEVTTDLDFMERHSETSLECRFRMTVEVPEATYTADIGAIYSLDEPSRPTNELIAEFAERIGFLSVFPYIREAISGMATRLNLPAPVLGIVRAGDFRITAPPEEGESQAFATST